VYYIVICLYKEYKFIIKGKISKNVTILLALYAICFINKHNLIIFNILLINTFFIDPYKTINYYS